MVTIHKDSRRNQSTWQSRGRWLLFLVFLLLIFTLIVSFFDFINGPKVSMDNSRIEQAAGKTDAVFREVQGVNAALLPKEEAAPIKKAPPQCPYSKLSDLTPSERHPKASETRHIVNPPEDTKVTLVCCETTKGFWNIAVHHSWAPLGALRFLDMVTSGYWDQTVPLMRCVQNFLCQFGLAGESSHKFKETLQDDPQWLPPGPTNRKNDKGVKRFAKGYFSYAGGGPNTRDMQIFVTLADDGPLGGGSPWEVPWGELVGLHSFETLDRIYTGYGEKGPKQGSLWEKGALEATKEKFPKLDWVLSCAVVDEAIDQVAKDKKG